MNSPRANDSSTQSTANETVHRSTRKNGSRYSGFLTIFENWVNPTYVFQPWPSSSPFLATNDPLPLSWNTSPVEVRVNVSAFGSYRRVGFNSTALRPSGWIALPFG